VHAVILTLATILLSAQAAPPPQTPFTTPLSLDEMKGKQAVVETSAGTFVLALLPEAAPNHAGYFIKLAREGAYDGTTFHRMVRNGIVQGGDPISKDPAKRDLYGRGGLGVLAREPNAGKHTRGAVSAVQVPNVPNSAGSQFFICVVDQPALDGQYDVFARVVEGLDVVRKISETPVDETGRAAERVEIKAVTIRDTPPPEKAPFADAPVEELARYRAILETSLGEIGIEFMPDKAPEHVRNFLRLSELGVYDGMAFHRVAPGFVIQTGYVPTRAVPLTERQQQYIRNLGPEFNDTKHVKGVVSMARGDDPASASTSFFIVTGSPPGLDGVYTAFGRVASGLDVVEAIEKVERKGEEPVTRIEVRRVRIERR
jgi:peptidyl-prolyl cis-trans isomerase B (cyclophilin B)